MSNDNSKEIILNKALLLFSTHGYDGTGIQDITAAAGVTKPTLYYFFGNKDGLFAALWKTYFPQLEIPLDKYCTYENHIADYENDLYGQLKLIVTVFFEAACSNADFYRLMMETVYAPPESKTSTLSIFYFKKLYALLERFFSGAAKAHGNLFGREQTFAISFLAQINAVIGTWLVLPETSPERPSLDENCAHLIVNQFLHGIFA